MHTIGQFALFGRVSARMLRHYDAIGLLHPARVDPDSGYRHYDESQLATLGRIVALRELGIGLDQIRGIVDGSTSAAGTLALLVARRAELQSQVHDDQTRIARLDERIRRLEGEPAMDSTTEVELKAVPATLIHEATAAAPGFGPENISPVIGPLYDRLEAALAASGVPARAPSIAYYTAIDESSESVTDEVVVHVGYLAEQGDAVGNGFELVELPELSQVATLLHHGAMSRIGESWGALFDWADQNGYRPVGYCREIYRVADSPDQRSWVTELQLPVEQIG